MAALVDTNVLVYRFDGRYPEKQHVATELLRTGAMERSLALPHQAIVEFVAVATRPAPGITSLLTRDVACREAEELLRQYWILYPNEILLRLALRGFATYPMSWFDAHLWAYAEYYGLDTIYSEDFQAGRLYGSVRIVNPFAA